MPLDVETVIQDRLSQLSREIQTTTEHLRSLEREREKLETVLELLEESETPQPSPEVSPGREVLSAPERLRQILRYLGNKLAGEWVTRKEIELATGLGHSSVLKYLQILIENKRVESMGTGRDIRYRLVPVVNGDREKLVVWP